MPDVSSLPYALDTFSWIVLGAGVALAALLIWIAAADA